MPGHIAPHEVVDTAYFVAVGVVGVLCIRQALPAAPTHGVRTYDTFSSSVENTTRPSIRRRYYSSASNGTCANTVQGRLFIADDHGTVCPRSAFDQSTGCCSGGLQYTCQSCSKEDRCCSLFEHCVSCCLNPDNNMASELDTTFRHTNTCAALDSWQSAPVASSHVHL